jgi:hypothetical protein
LINEYVDFTIQRNLNLVENEIVREFLKIDKMKGVIKRKGNLSAPEFDKIICPLFNNNKEKAAQMITKIMNMLLRV